MRLSYLLPFAAAVAGCAHRPSAVADLERALPSHGVYAVEGSGLTDPPLPRAWKLKKRLIMHDICSAVPVADHLLVTTASVFGPDFVPKEGFWRYDVYIVIGEEPLIMLDNPVYDAETGLVFIPTRRAFSPAIFRDGDAAAGEEIHVLGFTRSIKMTAGPSLGATTQAVRADVASGLCGAAVHDVEGRLVGVMRTGSGRHGTIVPVSAIKQALKRIQR